MKTISLEGGQMATNKIALSILIPTVVGREEKLNQLMKVLDPQFDRLVQLSIHSGIMPVEILIDKDNKEVSIGAKRQRLLEKALGEYVVFVDDDDLVSDDYIDQILNNLGEDAIGFLIDCFEQSRYTGRAKASRSYANWGENQDGYKYVRTIYHKTPVKRELALRAGFKDMRFGEDYDYCMRLKPFIKSENFIDKVLYYYRYEHEDHNTKYGIK